MSGDVNSKSVFHYSGTQAEMDFWISKVTGLYRNSKYTRQSDHFDMKQAVGRSEVICK